MNVGFWRWWRLVGVKHITAVAAGCDEEDEALELAAAVRARFLGAIWGAEVWPG